MVDVLVCFDWSIVLMALDWLIDWLVGSGCWVIGGLCQLVGSSVWFLFFGGWFGFNLVGFGEKKWLVGVVGSLVELVHCIWPTS